MRLQHGLREERRNAWSHALGFLIAAAGFPVLVVRAAGTGDPLHLVGCCIFGACLLATLAASALYHGSIRPDRKRILRIVDHASIFVLIAGSYTPFCLGSLRGPWGWSLLGIVWSAAFCGVVFKIFFTGRHDRFSTFLYLSLSWLAVVAIGPMMENMVPGALLFLVGAGICFTVGVVFYSLDGRRGFHFIWHLLVLAGCGFLYGAVFVDIPVLG